MPDMAAIEFSDPPAQSRENSLTTEDPSKNAEREELIEALREHPGRWAIVSRHTSRPAASKVARMLRVRHSDFSFQAARSDDGGVVHARFDGSR